MKTALTYLKIFVLIIASFFVFSVLSTLIPYESVRKNIEKSLPELLEEQDYPKVILKGDKYRQDNFTDALIFNTIASSDSKTPVRSAMCIPHYLKSYGEEYMGSVDYLNYKVTHIDIAPNMSYPRYWFGSAFVCRILLLIMDYQLIKWFLYLISTILLLVFAVKIVNKTGWIKSLPLFLALLFANFFVTQFSIQFFPVMAIALIGGIWMCENGCKPQKKNTMFLFITGMFSAYFDLLTTPLLTLGFPLTVYLILQSDEEKPVKEIFKSLFLLCFFWLVGYAGAWAAKWLLAAILADSTAINGAIDAIKWRTSTNNYTRWDAVVRNFEMIPLVWLNLVLTFLLLLAFFSFNKKGIKWAIAFLVVGLLPYMWYFVLSSHSHPHWWFTYRLQVMSMACVMSAFVSLIDLKRLKTKFIQSKNHFL